MHSGDGSRINQNHLDFERFIANSTLTMSKISPYRKTLKIFSILFKCSFSVFMVWFVALFLVVGGIHPSPAPPTDPTPYPKNDSPDFFFVVIWVGIVSFFTSIGSAIGFISTLILAWIKERRDRELFSLDLERRKLENEKLELELKGLRNAEGKPTPQD